MLREFWFGNEQEKQATAVVQKLKSQERLRPRQQDQLRKAQTLTRRVLLRRSLAGAGTLALGALAVPLVYRQEGEPLKVEKPFSGPQYENWTKYYNNDLPINSISAIAEDLIAAREYKGFPEAGQVLLTAVTDYKNLTQIVPGLTEPLKIHLGDYSKTNAIASFQANADLTGGEVDVSIIDKKTGVSFPQKFTDPKSNNIVLSLEQTMAFGSHAVKALLIGKEVSHFLYLPEMKKLVFDEFSAEFDIQTPSLLPLPDFIFNNSLLSLSNNGGYYYRNATVLIDWAGYWHITPAVGRMLKQGVFTPQDKNAIFGEIEALNIAMNRKILTETEPGVFEWKDGIGPFGKDWQDVMKSARNVPKLSPTRNPP